MPVTANKALKGKYAPNIQILKRKDEEKEGTVKKPAPKTKTEVTKKISNAVINKKQMQVQLQSQKEEKFRDTNANANKEGREGISIRKVK